MPLSQNRHGPIRAYPPFYTGKSSNSWILLPLGERLWWKAPGRSLYVGELPAVTKAKIIKFPIPL